MSLVTVLAIKPFSYCGRSVRAGDTVTMTPIEASVRAQAGEVSLLESVARPTYQTRDLTASAPAVPVAAAAVSEPVKVIRRRRRRTVKA